MISQDSTALDLLARVPVFHGLSRAQLQALLGIVSTTTCEAGDTVIREGEEGDSLFILANGSAEVTKTMTLVARQSLSSAEKTLLKLDGSQPACFGEMGMLEKAERSATVTAACRCDLFEIRRQDFERLAAEDPALGYVVVANVARMLSAYLRKANKDTLKLATALSIALGNR